MLVLVRRGGSTVNCGDASGLCINLLPHQRCVGFDGTPLNSAVDGSPCLTLLLGPAGFFFVLTDGFDGVCYPSADGVYRFFGLDDGIFDLVIIGLVLA